MSPSVLTLGTFDGVHRGHRAILTRVIARARARRARSIVLAFGMPPRHAGAPTSQVLLTTVDEKKQLLRQLGIDLVDILQFDRKTASTTAEDFFIERLVKQLGMVEMVVGPRVAFGKNRQGRLPLLRRLGRAHNVKIHVVSSVAQKAKSISSRRIRLALKRGRVDEAARLLGYPYSVEGNVVHGDKRGRTLGYPTANISTDGSKILPTGVYWVKVLNTQRGTSLDTTTLRHAADGLCNVGTRPTFHDADHGVHCEVFLLKGAKRLYGKRLRVIFMKKIRNEKKFRSGTALRRQIDADLSTTMRWIAAR